MWTLLIIPDLYPNPLNGMCQQLVSETAPKNKNPTCDLDPRIGLTSLLQWSDRFQPDLQSWQMDYTTQACEVYGRG